MPRRSTPICQRRSERGRQEWQRKAESSQILSIGGALTTQSAAEGIAQPGPGRPVQPPSGSGEPEAGLSATAPGSDLKMSAFRSIPCGEPEFRGYVYDPQGSSRGSSTNDSSRGMALLSTKPSAAENLAKRSIQNPERTPRASLRRTNRRRQVQEVQRGLHGVPSPIAIEGPHRVRVGVCGLHDGEATEGCASRCKGGGCCAPRLRRRALCCELAEPSPRRASLLHGDAATRAAIRPRAPSARDIARSLNQIHNKYRNKICRARGGGGGRKDAR